MSDIRVQVQDDNGEHIDLYTIDGVFIQPKLESWISRYIQPSNDGSVEAQQLARLMKTSLKGVLLLVGPQLLKLIQGPSHDKPPKGSDIVEWYIQKLASIGIAEAFKQDYIVKVGQPNEENIRCIKGFAPIPLPESE